MHMLEGWHVGRIEWFDIFPVEELLLNGLDLSEGKTALLVDIGGGRDTTSETLRGGFNQKIARSQGSLSYKIFHKSSVLSQNWTKK